MIKYVFPVVRESRGSQEDIIAAGGAEAAKRGFAIEKEIGAGDTATEGSWALEAAAGCRNGSAAAGGGRAPVEESMGFTTEKTGSCEGGGAAFADVALAAASVAALVFFAQASTAGARDTWVASAPPVAAAVVLAAASGFSVVATAAAPGNCFTASIGALAAAFRCRIIYIARAISAKKPNALATELPATTAVDALPAADLLSPAARPTGPRAERSAGLGAPKPTDCALPDAVALARAEGDSCSVPRALRERAGETVDAPVTETSAVLE